MTTIKQKNEARIEEEKRVEQRKRSALVIILHHLLEFGYIESAQKLQSESGINPNEYEVADNIDLLGIIQEFETYYNLKFNRKPKLMRRNSSVGDKVNTKARRDNYSLPSIGNLSGLFRGILKYSLVAPPGGYTPNVVNIQSKINGTEVSTTNPDDVNIVRKDSREVKPTKIAKLTSSSDETPQTDGNATPNPNISSRH